MSTRSPRPLLSLVLPLLAIPLLAILLLGVGCDPFSNVPFEQDQVFVESLPVLDDIDLSVPLTEIAELTQAGTGLAVGSPLLVTGNRVAREIHGILLASVDLAQRVSESPPAVRETNRRIWGPHPLPNVDAWGVLIVDLEDDGSLRWTAWGVREPTLDVVDGEEIFWGWYRPAGERPAAGGIGVDRALWRRIVDAPETTAGVLLCRFVLGEVRAIEVDAFRVARPDGAEPLSGRYLYRQGPREGSFHFTGFANVTRNPALERVDSHLRWRADGSGRTDAWVSGGDLEEDTVAVQECWDEEGLRVWRSLSFGADEEGDPSECSLGSAIFPDDVDPIDVEDPEDVEERGGRHRAANEEAGSSTRG